MALVRLYSPRSPLGDPIPPKTRLHQLGDEDIGYESKAVASPGGHDGLLFALGVYVIREVAERLGARP